MTGVNMTKQTNEIKENNIKSNLVELNKVWKQPQRCYGKKRFSNKQLFWKLPGEIFSQNPRKMSLKKFVFSKVAQSRSGKFLPKKETTEKDNFHKFLY